MGRIGRFLFAVLRLAPTRFTDDLSSVAKVASPDTEERSLPVVWQRRLNGPTPIKIAVSDGRADVLVSLLVCDERSKRRRQ